MTQNENQSNAGDSKQVPCSICGKPIETTHINAKVSHTQCAYDAMKETREALNASR